MRTTLTLDKDVAIQLKRMGKRRGERMKDLVNEALRRGLQTLENRPVASLPFKTRAVSLGTCLVGDVDNVSDVLALGEGDDCR